MKRKLLIVFGFCISSVTHACSVSEQKILNHYQQQIASTHQGQPLDFEKVSSVCKSWPARSGASILVAPYVVTADRHDEQFLGLAILLIDDVTGREKNRLDDFPVTSVDAIFPVSVTIDTADYKITDNARAFGIRIQQRNSSNVNPFNEDVINLYLPRQENIDRPLRGLVTHTSSGEGGGQCAYKERSSDAIISVATEKTGNFYNLNIRQSKKTNTFTPAKNGCVELKKNRLDTYVLKFSNNRYKIPSQLESITAIEH